MKAIVLIYKAFRKVFWQIVHRYEEFITYCLFVANNVSIHNFHTLGIPYIMVAIGGRMSVGKNFIMHNGISGNPIGCYQRCTFFVDRNAILTIGNNVGISQAALICHSVLPLETMSKSVVAYVFMTQIFIHLTLR